MGYSQSKQRANKRLRRVLILSDLTSFLEPLAERREEADTELVTEIAYLRESIDALETTLTQACETIEQVASLLHDSLHPIPFPEPLRHGPEPPEQELSSNGLVDFFCKEDEVPF